MRDEDRGMSNSRILPVHPSSFLFAGAAHQSVRKQTFGSGAINNLLKKAFRRWHMPEELPDSPVWKVEGSGTSVCIGALPYPAKPSHPAKQQAGATVGNEWLTQDGNSKQTRRARDEGLEARG